jgi:hypothetical protein
LKQERMLWIPDAWIEARDGERRERWRARD